MAGAMVDDDKNLVEAAVQSRYRLCSLSASYVVVRNSLACPWISRICAIQICRQRLGVVHGGGDNPRIEVASWRSHVAWRAEPRGEGALVAAS